jgi:hypothetical protein
MHLDNLNFEVSQISTDGLRSFQCYWKSHELPADGDAAPFMSSRHVTLPCSQGALQARRSSSQNINIQLMMAVIRDNAMHHAPRASTADQPAAPLHQ